MPEIPVSGVMIIEGEMTGDGRFFELGAVRWDDALPLPIIFDRDEGDHSGAVIGQIHTVYRSGQDIMGQGVLSDSTDSETRSLVARASELLDEGAVGVSVGVDSIRGHIRIDDSIWDDIESDDASVRIPISYDDITLAFAEARLRHLAIVDTPAFAGAALQKMPDTTGVLVAAASLDFARFFDAPDFGAPGVDPRLKYDPGSGTWSCPPSLEGDHYYGHVAPMGVCLRGRPDRCINPPDGDVEGFMRAYAPAAGGRRTGVVVLGGEHCDTGVGAVEATKHYDKTGHAGADVRVGRDAYGIWFSGMVRPGLSKDDRYALAASDVSGHWELDQRARPTLVGLPAVNVGGFAKGYLTAEEVAQGLAASAEIDCEPCLESRVDDLEVLVEELRELALAGMVDE